MSGLPRELEPEWTDDPWEATLYDQMDHTAVNRAFVADFLAGGPCDGTGLDLGTGTALIPIELCRQVPTVRILCTDAAASMLDLARIHVELARLQGQIQLAQADAKQMSEWSSQRFDFVISNSLLHHLGEPLAALHTAARLVKIGGRLFMRDLLRPDSTQRVEWLVHQYAGQEPEAAQQLLRQSLQAALTLEEMRQCADACGLDPGHIQQTSDRHWTLDTRRA
jgi:ubiquinone/menaquinone biosynthesis C-methylase UbiE